MLYNLDLLGRHTWVTIIKHILFSYGFGYAWLAQEVGNKGAFISEFVIRVSDICKQQWKGNLSVKPKLCSYIGFKSTLEPEKYLFLNCEFKTIRSLACLRCAVLPLHIEEGRHRGIEPAQRVCNVCNSMFVEDEYHFLLCCPSYNVLSGELIPYRFTFQPRLAYSRLFFMFSLVNKKKHEINVIAIFYH